MWNSMLLVQCIFLGFEKACGWVQKNCIRHEHSYTKEFMPQCLIYCHFFLIFSVPDALQSFMWYHTSLHFRRVLPTCEQIPNDDNVESKILLNVFHIFAAHFTPLKIYFYLLHQCALFAGHARAVRDVCKNGNQKIGKISAPCIKITNSILFREQSAWLQCRRSQFITCLIWKVD